MAAKEGPRLVRHLSEVNPHSQREGNSQKIPNFMRGKPPGNNPPTTKYGHLSPNPIRHSPSPSNNPHSIYTSPNNSFNDKFKKLKLMISPQQRKQPLPTDRSPD